MIMQTFHVSTGFGPIEAGILVVEFLVGTYCDLFIWSAVEINTAVISACLPTIRPVLQLGVTVSHNLLSSSKSSWSSALDATSSNVLKRKERNIFHHVLDSSQGSNVASKLAKGEHINTV